MKYIVRNCPALIPEAIVGCSEATLKVHDYCYEKSQLKCQDREDCIVKKAINLCLEEECPCAYEDDGCKWECNTPTIKLFSDDILELYKIEVIKE